MSPANPSKENRILREGWRECRMGEMNDGKRILYSVAAMAGFMRPWTKTDARTRRTLPMLRWEVARIVGAADGVVGE